MTTELLQMGLLQGLLLGIITFGIMIPFRFLNFPDLTAEGSYPLGGALCATCLMAGMHSIVSLVVGMLAGGLLAIGTAQVALRLKVNSLLAGIILSTMAYSIILRVMGKPNMALFDMHSLPINSPLLALIFLLCAVPFLLFLYSDFGLRFRAIGLNPYFAERRAISIQAYTSLGLFISGAIIGLAGGLMALNQQFMDIGMGVGIVIHGLASLMIGEAIIGNHTLPKQLAAPMIGALVYQQIQGLALSLGLAPSDLKFFTGMILLLVLALQRRGTKSLPYSIRPK